MAPPDRPFRFQRAEYLTVLLIAAIFVAVLLPRCHPAANDGTAPASPASAKQAAPVP